MLHCQAPYGRHVADLSGNCSTCTEDYVDSRSDEEMGCTTIHPRALYDLSKVARSAKVLFEHTQQHFGEPRREKMK